MQPVTDLDEDDPDVITHGQQQFLEILCLSGGIVSKDATTDFGQSFYDLGNFITKNILNIFNGIIRIFNDVMK